MTARSRRTWSTSCAWAIKLELRGPIGGYFVWEARLGGPLLLVAGGSGIVPLMAMLRHRAAVGSTVPTRLLYSSRAYDDIIYRDELDRLAASGDGAGGGTHADARATARLDRAISRRIDTEMLREVAWPAEQRPLAFICGPTPLVETAAASLVALGGEPVRIKTERFGPTGDARERRSMTRSRGGADGEQTGRQRRGRRLAGSLPFEMTMAKATCANCGATNVIGAVAAYMHGMGTVLRCPSCDNVLMRVAHANGRYLLDMHGVRVLQTKEG